MQLLSIIALVTFFSIAVSLPVTVQEAQPYDPDFPPPLFMSFELINPGTVDSMFYPNQSYSNSFSAAKAG